MKLRPEYLAAALICWLATPVLAQHQNHGAPPKGLPGAGAPVTEASKSDKD